MGESQITAVMAQIGRHVRKNWPSIATGLGITGMLSAGVLAVASTPKALDKLEQRRKKERCAKLNAAQTLQETWACYAAPIGMAIGSAICLVSANCTSMKRNAALATAYSVSETAAKAYRDKVVEAIGEKKETEIHNETAKDEVRKNPPKSSIIIDTGEKCATVCYDSLSGRYFRCSIDRLNKTENTINFRLRDEMYLSLNDYYDMLGLPSIEIGDYLGWKVEHGKIDIRYTSVLTDDLEEEQTPVRVVKFSRMPEYEFDS